MNAHRGSPDPAVQPSYKSYPPLRNAKNQKKTSYLVSSSLFSKVLKVCALDSEAISNIVT